MAFDRRRSGPPRNSGWLGPSAEAVGCRPRDLRVAFSALAFRRSTSQHRSAVLLPLLGFVSPLRRIPCARPLPETIRWRRSAPGSFHRADGATRRLPFRPRGLSPPRRFPPRAGHGPVASRFRPWGSPRFPASRIPRCPKATLAYGRCPRDALTLRRIPLDLSRTASPRPAALLPFPLEYDVLSTPLRVSPVARRSKA